MWCWMNGVVDLVVAVDLDVPKGFVAKYAPIHRLVVMKSSSSSKTPSILHSRQRYSPSREDMEQ